MSRVEKEARRAHRPTFTDPFYAGEAPGYAQPSAGDSAGYSIRDPEADSGLPDRYGMDHEPVSGSIHDGAPAGSASIHSRLGMEGHELQHAIRGAPLEYSSGCGPEHSIASGVVPYVGDLYDGGGWPEPSSGSYRGPMPAARAFPISQELANVDDYGDSVHPVSDLGRGSPGPLRSSMRGGDDHS